MEEKKKKGHGCLIALIVFVVVIALGIGGCYLAYRSVKKTITQKVEDVKESTSILNEWSDAINQVSGLVNGLNSIQGGLDGNENETTVELKEDSYDKILKDFNSGAISADECVKQILYANYNDEKLSESYKVDGACDNYIDVDSLFEEYHDKLSDETKIYYYEKLLMTNVSVAYDNPKTASDDVARFKSPFCLEAKAYSMVYSLDYVYTSSNGRFRIWYTTTGDNAITHDQATSIGESLETASSNYDSLFNTQYRYDGYKLGNEQIGYVNDIMNVYIIDTGETSYAHYRFCFDDDCVRNDLVELLGVITGNSPLGISFLPYIIIRPDVVNDMQNGGLVINHELIHHYQSQVLPYTYNNGVAIDKDNSYLTEGLADWGSAMVSPSAKLPNYLSGHASMYRNQSHAFTTDYEDIIKSKGYDNFELWAGYLHFPVLDAYNNSVANGVEKMANAYFARTNGKTEYKYLEDHMTLSEARDFTQYLSYKTLSQDYNNSNFMADTSEGTLNINEVKLNDRIDAEELGRICMRYYEFDASENISEIHVAKLGEPLDAPEEKVDIKSTFSSNEKTFAYLYGYNNGTYDLLDECFILSSQILVVPENSGYSKFYVVVCNGNLAEDHKDLQYTIRFDGKIVETGEDNSNDKVFDTDISNYHVKITTDMTAVGVQTQTISEGTVDEVHQKEHLVNVTNAMGMDIETEIYTNYATGVSYTKIPFTGQWEKSNDGSQTVKMSTVLEQFEKKGKVEQVSANCYKVTLPVKSLTGTIKGQSGTSLAFTKDEVTSYVYTSGKYITRMELDYSDAVTIMDKLVIVIEFSNYNKEGDVVFPSNLK